MSKLQIKFTDSADSDLRVAVVSKKDLARCEKMTSDSCDLDYSHVFLEYLQEEVQDGWERFSGQPGESFGSHPHCVVGQNVVVVTQFVGLDV